MACYPTPKWFNTPRIAFEGTTLPQVSSEVAQDWCITEVEVLQRWQRYAQNHLLNYERTRNFLTENSSSQMSPYIRCGLISL